MHATEAPAARRILIAAGLLLALAPAAARADSLVFVKDGQVWISQADGSGARPVTASRNGWAWPSEADDGSIFVAGGVARVNPGGTDSDGSSEIYHLDQAGAQLGAAINTPGSASSPACPTYPPTHLRVSPNGRRVVYDAFHCDYQYPFLEDAATGHFESFATDYSDPQWLDDTRVLITHIGPTFGNASFAVYDTVARDGHGPSDDPYMTGREATASRDGRRVAVLENDGPEYFDGARHADIQLYASSGGDVTQPIHKCTLTLDPDNIRHFAAASPAFSPDGSRLAWAEDDGIHMASTGNLDACATVTNTLLIAGGAYPSFGSGAATAAPPPTPTPPPTPIVAPLPCCPPLALTLTSPAKRAKLNRSGAFALPVTASAAGTLTVAATVKVAKRTFRFRAASAKLVAGKRVNVVLKLSKRDARKVRTALKHKRLTAAITLTATADSGQRAERRLKLTITR